MKALTVKNPWAWLIAAGHKKIENRSWPTRYRGRLLIHAGATTDRLTAATLGQIADLSITIPAFPQCGAIVATATLADCVRFEDLTGEWAEHPFRGYGYCWLFTDVKAMKPIPCKGALGLWTPTPAILETCRS